mmetsp:Transcript_101078/g.324690  ORF Transcript_101078/g.324690 Transcript_101078/m.324690 type:complete len:210 (-) Transcript_101078:1749-2378(-)
MTAASSEAEAPVPQRRLALLGEGAIRLSAPRRRTVQRRMPSRPNSPRGKRSEVREAADSFRRIWTMHWRRPSSSNSSRGTPTEAREAPDSLRKRRPSSPTSPRGARPEAREAAMRWSTRGVSTVSGRRWVSACSRWRRRAPGRRRAHAASAWRSTASSGWAPTPTRWTCPTALAPDRPARRGGEWWFARIRAWAPVALALASGWSTGRG